MDSIEEILEMDLPIGGRLENMDWFDNGDEIDELVFSRYNHSEFFRCVFPSKSKNYSEELFIL